MSSKGESGAKPQPTSIWLDDETKSALAHLTKELNMNRSAVIREAVRRMVTDDQSAEVRRLVAQLERAVSGGV